MARSRQLEPPALAVVSPHLDDAVFACGHLLARERGAVVVTLFAGIPPAGRALPEWDAACGFASARQAMLARRREDRAALTALAARPCWIGCLDAQYRDRVPDGLPARLARALARVGSSRVAVPLGLFHEDHRLVHLAARTLIAAWGGWEWLVYEDAIYRGIPGLADEQLTGLRRAGFEIDAIDAEADGHTEAKTRAVACYASQLRGLASAGRPGHADTHAPERYWRVRRTGRCE